MLKIADRFINSFLFSLTMAKVSKDFFQNVGVSIASLTFGVALSIFIYAVSSGKVPNTAAWLLFITSFLLLLRFWWRYVELFARLVPSHTFWQFTLDFIIAFCGVIAVLYLSNIKLWATIVSALMLASIIRCALAWKESDKSVQKKLKRTVIGAVVFLILAAIIYFSAPFVSEMVLAAGILAISALFILYSAAKE